MSQETMLEVNTIINNIVVNLMTIYQRDTYQRKMLREFLIEFGLAIDELNSDVSRIIKNIFKMTKKELEAELKK